MNHSLELIMQSLSTLLLFYLIYINIRKTKSTEAEAPEPAGAWPIIGHSHLLANANEPLHKTLGVMADQYGPAFNICLGTTRALVVSSWEVAKQCFKINDKALASRPNTTAFKHMCYNNTTFSFGPYTPFWNEMKKLTMLELPSNRRVETLKDVRVAEISLGIKELYVRWTRDLNGALVMELNEWVEHMMLNIIVMMVAGKRYGSGDNEGAKCKKAIMDFIRLSGDLVVSDVIPLFSWLDLGGYEKEMKKTARDFDSVLGGWLDEHRRKRNVDLGCDENDGKDFIDAMLSLEDEGKLYDMEHDPDTSIKSTCMALVLAGGNSIMMGVLTWAISLLLNHPDVLKNLQDELDNHVGKERQVDESDIKNLVFLEAIIKETLRLYPGSPIILREAIEDCTVAGYNVKSGTRIMINLWKLQRDERVWSDPSKFQPERFIGTEHEQVDLTGHQFVLVPFGFGRRYCPGVTLALQVVHLTLARLVHSFDLGRRGGLLVDMTEGAGLTLAKKEPLEVLLTPRLTSKLYGC